jgi:hypothetical protein
MNPVFLFCLFPYPRPLGLRRMVVAKPRDRTGRGYTVQIYVSPKSQRAKCIRNLYGCG